MNKEDSFIVNYLTSGSKKNNENSKKSYSIIANRNGSIRWAYPSNLKIPTFLSFYSSSSFRSRVYSSLVRGLFLFRLSILARTKQTFFLINRDSILQDIINRYPDYTHSIFTGTVGINRKVIIVLSKKYESLVFAKIAISDNSKYLINNEFSVLNRLHDNAISSLNIPKVLYYDNKKGILEISSIKPKKYTQPSRLLDVHIALLDKINSKRVVQCSWSHMDMNKEIEGLITSISARSYYDNGLDVGRVDDYLNNIQNLLKNIDSEKIFNCGLYHGDFTPWNMYLSDKQLYVYDWELSKDNIPLLFDMFHFIFQSEIMIHHSEYSYIKDEVYRVLYLKSSRDFLDKYSIDVNTSFMLYIVYISTYYLDLYVKQSDLHKQVFWLIDIWESAANDLFDNNGVIFNEE